MTDKEQKTVEHVLSLSYGKDSMACFGAIEKLGWPLDRVITAEVWATDTIPADLPPMMEFKAKADKIIKERWGIDVEHVCAMKKGEPNNYEKQFYDTRRNKATDSDCIYGFPCQKGPWCNSKLKVSAIDAAQSTAKKKTYEDMFYTVRQSGSRKGQIVGFPFPNAPECNSALKMPPIWEIEKMDVISYLGIAADEPSRFHNLNDTHKSPLVEVGWTEADCRKWCEDNDLLSPIYRTALRGGVGSAITKVLTSFGSFGTTTLSIGL